MSRPFFNKDRISHFEMMDGIAGTPYRSRIVFVDLTVLQMKLLQK